MRGICQVMPRSDIPHPPQMLAKWPDKSWPDKGFCLCQGKPLSKPLPSADYYALISRAQARPNCEVYHWSLRDPLPTIPIPLRAPDPDISVDLGKVFRETYERGRYARMLYYTRPPVAQLTRKDAQWATGVATKKTR